MSWWICCHYPSQNGPELTDADRQQIDQRLEGFLADGAPGLDADAALDAIERAAPWGFKAEVAVYRLSRIESDPEAE